jgi:hypothetical protein
LMAFFIGMGPHRPIPTTGRDIQEWGFEVATRVKWSSPGCSSCSIDGPGKQRALLLLWKWGMA